MAALITPGLYRLATRLIGPLVPVILRRRLARGKEDPARLGERQGRPGRARPPGPLVWCHGASVGEMVSLLPLVAALRQRWPQLTVLVTTGSVTSAQLFAQRVSDPQVIHQFVPVDHPAMVKGFLDHWRPDLGLLVESELWPNLILTAARRMPLVLANGHMSARSLAGWQRRPRMIRPLLAAFSAILAQSALDRDRFIALGAADAVDYGQIKFDAPPLPADPVVLAGLDGEIGRRPRLIAASTHEGEEALILAVHQQLLADHPDLLTVIIPRHPERGAAVADLVRAAGLPLARRSLGQPIAATTAIYLADTLGELGLWFRLGDFAFIGGSLVPRGGHNPLEPARFGRAVLIGPDTANCADPVAVLAAAGALQLVADQDALTAAARRWLADPAAAQAAGAAGAAALAGSAGAIARTLDRLAPLLAPVLARGEEPR